MKLRCTNKDERAVVLAFINDDESIMSAVSLAAEVFDAEIGDEFRLVKVAKRKGRAKRKAAPAPEQGGARKNVRRARR